MFHNCKSSNEKKKLYRRLSKRLHPDCGGEQDLMILLTESFEKSMEIVSFQRQKSTFEEDLEREYTKKHGKHSEKTVDPDEDWDGKFVHVDGRVLKSSKRIKIIDDILAYAKEHSNFKKDFVKSVEDFLISSGFITEKQYNCLVDLYYARKIDEWIKEKT